MDVKVIFVLFGAALMVSLFGTGVIAAKTDVAGSTVDATIDFDPDAINLKSQGKFVTCWISLPEDYNVKDISKGSISIERIGKKTVSVDALNKFHKISDHDDDGRNDLMVKFDRKELIDLLYEGDDIKVLVTGKIGSNDLKGIGLITAFDPTKEVEDSWKLLYSSDFSSDPSWITNSPSRYYWVSSTETYFASMVDRTNSYSYVDVDYGCGSFVVEVDFKISSISWFGDFSFGLYSPTLMGANTNGQLIEFTFGNGGSGYGSGLQVRDSSGVWRTDITYPISTWSFNTWYHLVIEYNDETGVVTALMTDMNGNVAQSCSVSGVSGFDDVSCLALSKVVGWFASGATANGYIDNVSLSEYVSEV